MLKYHFNTWNATSFIIYILYTFVAFLNDFYVKNFWKIEKILEKTFKNKFDIEIRLKSSIKLTSSKWWNNYFVLFFLNSAFPKKIRCNFIKNRYLCILLYAYRILFAPTLILNSCKKILTPPFQCCCSHTVEDRRKCFK